MQMTKWARTRSFRSRWSSDLCATAHAVVGTAAARGTDAY